MTLIKIATMLRSVETGTYEPAYEAWVNPEKIVSVYPASSGDAIIIHMGGDRHHTVSHEEWAGIEPLLTGIPAPSAPVLPQGVIDAYDEYQRMLSLTGISMAQYTSQAMRVMDAIAIARSKGEQS